MTNAKAAGHGEVSLILKLRLFRSSNSEEKRMKRPKKLPSKLRLKISGNQRRRRDDTFVVWEEIPTPSVCDHRDTMNSEASSSPPSAPTQERLMQVRAPFIGSNFSQTRASRTHKSLHVRSRNTTVNFIFAPFSAVISLFGGKKPLASQGESLLYLFS
nr:hypothetical protein C46H11.5 - Caenorhabditis elegans [Caenorhabditis elegans]